MAVDLRPPSARKTSQPDCCDADRQQAADNARRGNALSAALSAFAADTCHKADQPRVHCS